MERSRGETVLRRFNWVPADGQRHASADPLPECAFAYPEGTAIATLCGRELTARAGVIAWLWWTCPACDDKAHELAGLRRFDAARTAAK